MVTKIQFFGLSKNKLLEFQCEAMLEVSGWLSFPLVEMIEPTWFIRRLLWISFWWYGWAISHNAKLCDITMDYLEVIWDDKDNKNPTFDLNVSRMNKCECYPINNS